MDLFYYHFFIIIRKTVFIFVMSIRFINLFLQIYKLISNDKQKNGIK